MEKILKILTVVISILSGIVESLKIVSDNRENAEKCKEALALLKEIEKDERNNLC